MLSLLIGWSRRRGRRGFEPGAFGGFVDEVGGSEGCDEGWEEGQ